MYPNEIADPLHSPYWLDIPPFPERTFTVSSFASKHLALNSNYEYTIQLHTQARITPSTLLSQPAKLILDDTMTPKVIHGVVNAIQQLTPANNYFVYELVLTAPTIALTTMRQQRVFLQQTIQDIANTVLARLVNNIQCIRWNLSNAHAPRDLIVQHNETDWDFLRRILSSENISFTFLHNDNLELVLFDTLNSLPSVGALPYAAQASMMRTGDTVWNVRAQNQLTSSSQQTLYYADTDNMIAQPGMLLTITGHPDTTINQSYRVISQTITGHVANQNSGPNAAVDDDEAPQFISELTLLPATSAYQTPILYHSDFYGSFIAQTESVTTDTQAHLNEDGHYRVRLGFDKSDTESAQASPPLMLVQPHGGASSGFHHPLLPKTPVIIGARDGNIEDPIILGAWPDLSQQTPINRGNRGNPVTSANANDQIMRSSQGHTVQLTDHSDAPFVAIESADAINQLLLQSDLNNPFVALSTQGSLSLNAKKTLTRKTEQSANHSVGGNANMTTTQNQHVLVSGQSTYQSGADILTQTKQHLIRQTTGSNMVQQAHQDMLLQAKNNHSYASEQGNITLNSAQVMNLISATDLTIGTDQNLFLESNGHVISFSSGNHIINANTITLNAPTINVNGSSTGLNPTRLSGSSSNASAFGNNAVSIPQNGADMFVDGEKS